VVEHIFPKSLGGTDGPENLVYVCARHNLPGSGVPGLVFERLIANLLEASAEFFDVVVEGRIGATTYIADVLAKRVGSDEPIFIECKSYSTITEPRLESAIRQLTRYRKAAGFGHVVLAFPGLADEQALARVKRHSIELWDLKKIKETFRKEIEEIRDPYLKALLKSVPEHESVEERLI